eukprot:TCALIF_07511-PA protein Name:"Protein of unknown function" AED:0.46 eAED:0.46 QI:0/0/0/0.33/0.2/0.33/6/0/406
MAKEAILSTIAEKVASAVGPTQQDANELKEELKSTSADVTGMKDEMKALTQLTTDLSFKLYGGSPHKQQEEECMPEDVPQETKRSSPRIDTNFKPEELTMDLTLASFKTWRTRFEKYFRLNEMEKLSPEKRSTHLLSCINAKMENHFHCKEDTLTHMVIAGISDSETRQKLLALKKPKVRMVQDTCKAIELFRTEDRAVNSQSRANKITRESIGRGQSKSHHGRSRCPSSERKAFLRCTLCFKNHEPNECHHRTSKCEPCELIRFRGRTLSMSNVPICLNFRQLDLFAMDYHSDPNGHVDKAHSEMNEVRYIWYYPLNGLNGLTGANVEIGLIQSPSEEVEEAQPCGETIVDHEEKHVDKVVLENAQVLPPEQIEIAERITIDNVRSSSKSASSHPTVSTQTGSGS